MSYRSGADRHLFAALVALLLWLPLPLGSNRPWAHHLFELLLFVLLAVWCWHYGRGRAELTPALRRAGGLLLPLGLWVALMALQLLPLPAAWVAALRPVDPLLEAQPWLSISIDPYATWVHLRLSLALLGLVFLTLVLVDRPARVRVLLLALVVSGVAQAVYGSLMTLSGLEWGFFMPKADYYGVATGTFWNRNHLANYLVLCLAAGTALLLADLYQGRAGDWRERGRRLLATLLGDKLRVRLGLALMVIALVLTRSRMGNTAFFASLLLAGLVWLLCTRRITRGSIILLVSLILVDTLIVGTWFGIDEVRQRLETTAFSRETRDEVNRDSWRLIRDQPWFGSGAGSYYTAFPRYRQADIQSYYDHAHNDYFELLAEHGVVGCLPLAVLLLASLVQALAAMRRRRALLYQALAFAPLMALLAMLLHSTVDFSLQIPANAATFLVLLSLAWIARHQPSRSAPADTGVRLRGAKLAS